MDNYPILEISMFLSVSKNRYQYIADKSFVSVFLSGFSISFFTLRKCYLSRLIGYFCLVLFNSFRHFWLSNAVILIDILAFLMVDYSLFFH